MNHKSTILTLTLMTLLVLGMGPVVSAHGGDDGGDQRPGGPDHPGMPGLPNLPGLPGWPGMGNMDGMPHYEMGDDAVWISSDIMTIMAMEEMPAFQFWYTNDNNGSMARFMAAYGMISEFNDTNGDGAFQFDEALYYAPLGAYEWSIQTGSIVDDNGTTTEVWLKYTKGGIKSNTEDHHGMFGTAMMPHMYLEGADVNRFKDTTIQIWTHIYYENYTGTVEDSEGIKANYTVIGGAELKVDIEIGNFQFSNNNTKAAIQTMLNENMAYGHMMNNGVTHMFRTQERYGSIMGNSMMNWTTEGGNETRFEDRLNTHMQQIDFLDGQTDITQGFYRWINKAVINWPGGVSETVNVTASYVPTGMGISLFFAYPNFDNGTLLHDPSVGLVEGSGPEILSWTGPVIIVGIGIIGVIALIIIRRR